MNFYNQTKNIYKNLHFAFTMAEAVLVMTILGIIASIMLTTLKPAEYKEKAMQIMAEKTLNDVDQALQQVLLNNSNGSLQSIIDPDDSTKTISISNFNHSQKFKKVISKYLKISRTPCEKDKCFCNSLKLTSNNSSYLSFYLNSGACVGIHMLSSRLSGVYFPDYSDPDIVVGVKAILYIDTNGEKEPNTLGKDRFQVPISNRGIDYEANECHVLYCSICAPDNPDVCIECINGSYVVAKQAFVPTVCDIVDGQCKNCREAQ